MPHPPQTDGLSERFNQTLKCMLRILITSTGSGWDKWPALTLSPTGNYHRHKQDFQRLNFSLDNKHRVPLPSWRRVKQEIHDRVGQVQFAEEKKETTGPYKEKTPSFWLPHPSFFWPLLVEPPQSSVTQTQFAGSHFQSTMSSYSLEKRTRKNRV